MITESDQTTPISGAYGLAMDGSLINDRLGQDELVRAPTSWPSWEIRWRVPEAEQVLHPVTAMTWSPEQAVFPSATGGRITVERIGACTTLELDEPPTAAALLHPLLASTGMIVGHWLGRFPFHAGAFQFAGRAWGVLGGREMGKSSLLMGMHSHGLPILTDDLLVLNGNTAYAGPRCLDLRKSAADHFGAGEYLGVIGTRERWRVELAPIEAEVPFAGWVLIGWSDRISVDAPTPSTRLAALAQNRALTLPGVAAPGLLAALQFPMVAFARPRHWHQADAATSTLLRALEEQSDASESR
jgi:hypothetical protein